MSLTDPADAKRVMRLLIRARPGNGHEPALIDQILSLPWPADAVIAGVWPLRGEPSLVPALAALHVRGHRVVLPETTPPGQSLVFRCWAPGTLLRPGRFGTMHPGTAAARPDIVLVPLLAWDRSLARLGHGGGYYDRTLAALPGALGIGYGLASQEVAAVPVGPHDVRLDAMVTERGLIMGEGRTFEDLVSGRRGRTQRS